MAARPPAEAQQPGVEVELGGGFHIPISGIVEIELPAVPALDLRAVRWGGKWGVSARVLVGFVDANRHGEPTSLSHPLERQGHPTYIQFLLRYRTEQGVFFGVGGGVDRVTGLHIGAFEVLKSISLTERASIRVGVTTLGILQITPVALLAWKF